ncbi:MAG: heme-binding domain-containing protein [Bryobacterales bacterium]|nr:heme-binding domain-containing protein [Bryobacterales bacterium]
MNKKMIMIPVVLLGALGLAIQLVPYGRNHANPPVRQEPQWDRPETRQLAQRACFDCHSNETKWPWYASVAPVSWFTQRHVDKGRRDLNFSEWDLPQKEAKKAVKELQQGKMPLQSYTLAHPQARLQPAEQQLLMVGLKATLQGQSGTSRARHHDDDDDRE